MLERMNEPTRVFAVRALSSLETPETKADMLRHRSAFTVTLEAAGVDMSNLRAKPSASYKETYHHALLCWYDMTADELRLFAPGAHKLDETTESALSLLDGVIIGDWEDHEIEEVDAAIRLMALMGTGGATAAELHANHVVPNLARYDEDFTPPDLDDLESMWCQLRPYYLGGTSAVPNDLDVWVDRTYAFGI